MTIASLSALVVAAGAVACSSSSSESTAKAPSQLADGCPQNSGYTGDGMCLAPPAATDGFQLHFGPDSYDDPAKIQPYLLGPNSEINDCYYEKTSNTTDRYFSGYAFNMRPGSHHIITNVNTVAQPDGFATCQANDQSPGLLGASETPSVDQMTDPAPENQGLAVRIPANSQAVINFHNINTGAAPALREAWLNYYYIDPSQVKGIRGNVFLVGGLGYQIPPGTKQTFQYSCCPSRPVRILSLAAHMHAATSRLTMWKVSNGQASMVYESYDWANPVAYFYDSVHKNTMPQRDVQVPGATTGPMTLQPGESIQWECAVENKTDVTLTFRNEVYTGEMRIVGGTMVPADDPMNPYDFTCALN